MFKKKRWSELGPLQQIAVITLSLVQIGLLLAALWDIRRRADAQINGSKALWIAAAFINFIGPIAYFSFGRKPPT
jgi:hypothetical protein